MGEWQPSATKVFREGDKEKKQPKENRKKDKGEDH